jgi:hypothetical protein
VKTDSQRSKLNFTVEKLRQGLIHNAKVKRTYYRTLKREEKSGTLPKLLDGPVDVYFHCSVLFLMSQELGSADLETLHPSRSKALTESALPEPSSFPLNENPHSKIRERPRHLTKTEKFALAEAQRQEREKNQKDRERKIKLREKKRKDLRKMTAKGQPVMKPRLEDLLGKVKKIMNEN